MEGSILRTVIVDSLYTYPFISCAALSDASDVANCTKPLPFVSPLFLTVYASCHLPAPTLHC